MRRKSTKSIKLSIKVFSRFLHCTAIKNIAKLTIIRKRRQKTIFYSSRLTKWVDLPIDSKAYLELFHCLKGEKIGLKCSLIDLIRLGGVKLTGGGEIIF